MPSIILDKNIQMSRYLFFTLLAVQALLACTSPVGGDPQPSNLAPELKLVAWTQGNWKCDLTGAAFYQMHHFTSDSTMTITTYQWNGKDTSGTQVVPVVARGGKLHFGASGEWRSEKITDSEVNFYPIRSGWNSIRWAKGANADTWTVEMSGTTTTAARTMTMKKAPGTAELLKK